MKVSLKSGRTLISFKEPWLPASDAWVLLIEPLVWDSLKDWMPTPHTHGGPRAFSPTCPLLRHWSRPGLRVLQLCISHALLSAYRCAERSASPSHLRGAARPPPCHPHIPLLLLLRGRACRLMSNFVRLLQFWAMSQMTSGICFDHYSVVDRSSSLTQSEGGSPGALIHFFFLVLASEPAQGSPGPLCCENTRLLVPFQVTGMLPCGASGPAAASPCSVQR